jgi:hypothetical protein
MDENEFILTPQGALEQALASSVLKTPLEKRRAIKHLVHRAAHDTARAMTESDDNPHSLQTRVEFDLVAADKLGHASAYARALRVYYRILHENTRRDS